MNKIPFQLPLALGLVGAGLLATGTPAQAVAITYVFNNNVNFANGTLTGSFDYNSGANAYSNFNVTSSAGGNFPALTYTSLNSVRVSGTANGFNLSFNGPFPAPPYPTDTFLRTLTVNFNSPLGNFGNVPIGVTNPGRSVEILQAGADTQNPDIADVRNVVNANSPSVTGIPLETDALPVAATMAVVGGMLWRRQRKRAQVALDLTQSATSEKI